MAKRNWGFIGGSIILFITFNIFQALNYLFHFSMARLLTISEYGVLAALFSILYILAIFSESIQTIIARYSSVEDNPGKLKNIVKKSLKKSLKVSLILFCLYTVLSFILSPILGIGVSLLLLNGIIIFSSFILPITRGVMQGRKMFGSLGINLILEGFVKFFGALALVLIGWKVYGAIAATAAAMFIAFFYSFFTLRPILNSQEKKAATPNIYAYSKPVIVVTLSTLIMYSIDIIIAKIVFSPEIAGIYAISSMMSKTIVFATQPIVKAMFPLSSQANHKGKQNLFRQTLMAVAGCIVVALIVFYFFPGFIIWIFSGKTIVASAQILFYLGIVMGAISLSYTILSYKLSRGMLQGYTILMGIIPIQLALMFYFSHNLVQFSMAFIVVAALFLWASVFLVDNEGINNNSSV
ncbi:oligosaccharide flippase family protein [Candidatus Pacearchaeota archaeon]|nr:oligosaccharide flippase family protein [Candidatus Pacearchaeota archaeon]